MKKALLMLMVVLPLIFIMQRTTGQKGDEKYPDKKQNGELTVNTRIDCMKYWMKAAEMGLVPYNPPIPFKPAEYTGSEIDAWSVTDENSIDIPVTSATNVTESENSIAVNPNNPDHVLNSNNSTSWSGGSVGSLYGANYFYSTNGGQMWGGSSQGAGGSNSGDPVALFNLAGRQYVGYIHSNYGQGVSYSDNGTNWTAVLVANPPSGWSSMLDKNHLWVDNSLTSTYEGNVYDAWTTFGGTYDSEIGFSRSTNDGVSWSSVQHISAGVNAGSHNQGVNISTGPDGEVYVVWTIYDSWPSDECALGFAKSTNGGQTFGTATRIITNIKGIRTSETNKNMRVNSFPSMTVDISNGPNRGNIYVVWTNIGQPGVNSGTNRSVYMIRSTNGGSTWSTPVRVNQGSFVNGKEAYFPWITCDPESGVLSSIYYDDRNTSSASCEVFAANSYDGGLTWEDFKVSDVSFTPSPISGLASSYMGDYLGISAYGGKVYPCWTDNRGGLYMTYVSPYSTNNLPRPTNLVANLNQANGHVDLSWDFTFGSTFQNFNIYRDNVLIGTTTTTTYADNLPAFGPYQYKVSAQHTNGESLPAAASVQWGYPDISVSPTSFYVTIPPNTQQTESLTITNIGQWVLNYTATTQVSGKDDPKAYCTASGGCDEYISRVQLGSIDNSSACDGYHDYTSLSTSMMTGQSYQITVTNGVTLWPQDQCGIWIDWNKDEDFSDAGETMTVSGTPGVGPYTATITPPSGAASGTTRMRVRIIYTGTLSPCGTTSYGEAEDYSINVIGWLSATPPSGTINAGASQTLNVLFDATGLALGIYTGSVVLNSDDPDSPQVLVPCTLNVSLGTPMITVSPLSLDFGDVPLGSNNTLPFVIENPGTAPLSGTITTPAGFTAAAADKVLSPLLSGLINPGDNSLTYNVPAGTNKTFNLTFAPSSVQAYGGNVVIVHNAGGGDKLIAVTGNGVPGQIPDISISPASLIASQFQNATSEQTLHVVNNGLTDLTYSTSEAYPWLSVTNNGTGTVPAGNSLDVTVNFNSTGMSVGLYYGGITFSSNDPFDPVILVPCTLEVINANVVNLRAYLQGPFSGTEMNRFLNIYGLLPTAQPYNAAPWYYMGTETASPIPNTSVVDWVLVELRETQGGPATATSSTMIARKAGLILKNGYIVETDGVTPLQFPLPFTYNVYPVIWHRNHLGIISSQPIVKTGSQYTYDFTTSYTQAYGGINALKQLANGIWGMFGADGNADGRVNNQDKLEVWYVQVGLQGYLSGDFTLNSQVDNQDKLDVWKPNSGRSSQVPGNTLDGGISCQVPK